MSLHFSVKCDGMTVEKEMMEIDYWILKRIFKSCSEVQFHGKVQYIRLHNLTFEGNSAQNELDYK